MLSILLIMFFVLSFAGVVTGAGKGNARKGKYLFRKNCRTCHQEGKGANELSPISKTQAQWKKVFEGCDKLACRDVWAKLSEKDLEDMFAYLHGHAFDSPSPAKCQ